VRAVEPVAEVVEDGLGDVDRGRADLGVCGGVGHRKASVMHLERNEWFRSILPEHGYAVQMEMAVPQRRLSGRGGQAMRNDQRIPEAAREVFMADPGAPIAAVAARAGVGISALYRRYPSKEALLAQVARDGLRRYNEVVEAAVADDGDAWQAFADFMARILEAGTHAIASRLAGTFTPTPDLMDAAAHAAELNTALLERTKERGGLRPDVVVDDLSLILEQLHSIRLGDEARTWELRRRYLALALDGLRVTGSSLPGPGPSPEELASRWIPAG
jgi:AcrR family transcriptional regulator